MTKRPFEIHVSKGLQRYENDDIMRILQPLKCSFAS